MKTSQLLVIVVVSVVLTACAGGSGGDRVYDPGASANAATPVANPAPSPSTPSTPIVLTPVPSPVPSQVTVDVRTESELQFEIRNAVSNTRIRIAAGTYQLTNTLHLTHGVENVTIQGATGNRDDVVLVGRGMSQQNYGNVPHGIMLSDAQDILIADLSIRDVYYHPITLQAAAGCQRVTMRNLRLINAGEQFIKANSSPNDGVNDSLVEDCIMEYVTTARSDYTNGVDVHQGLNWVIRGCTFRNLIAPAGAGLAGPAVLMWNRAGNTIVENNIFVNCARGIAFGLSSSRPDDHTGGIIRNNIIFRDATVPGDVGIILTNAPNATILHNTIVLSGTYPNAIEYRYNNTTNALIENNFCDSAIRLRNGASAQVANNRSDATYSDFIDPMNGDFHLDQASIAIDQGAFHNTVLTDMDGESRPKGGAPDLGADEAQ